MEESPLEEDVSVLTITKALPEEKTKKYAKIWHSLPSNEGLDNVRPAMPDVLQVLDGTDKERSLSKNKFVT